MGFSLLLYNSSIATGSVLVPCKPIPDPNVATIAGDGNGYIITDDMKLLLAAFAFGANLTRAQIQTPKFNLTAYQEIAPLANAGAGAGAVPQLNRYFEAPRGMKSTEELVVQVIQGGGVAENDSVVVFVGDKVPARVDKEHFSIRFTAATTLTANGITNITPTFDRALPAGKYDVIGGRPKTAGGIAFRIVIPGVEWRPGGIASQADTAILPEGQRHGGWGVWGTFNQNLPPTIDVLSTSADTAESGELDLVGPY